jgi:hypothetical protein
MLTTARPLKSDCGPFIGRRAFSHVCRPREQPPSVLRVHAFGWRIANPSEGALPRWLQRGIFIDLIFVIALSPSLRGVETPFFRLHRVAETLERGARPDRLKAASMPPLTVRELLDFWRALLLQQLPGQQPRPAPSSSECPAYCDECCRRTKPPIVREECACGRRSTRPRRATAAKCTSLFKFE